jgi:hypothetical protein
MSRSHLNEIRALPARPARKSTSARPKFLVSRRHAREAATRMKRIPDDIHGEVALNVIVWI